MGKREKFESTYIPVIYRSFFVETRKSGPPVPAPARTHNIVASLQHPRTENQKSRLPQESSMQGPFPSDQR